MIWGCPAFFGAGHLGARRGSVAGVIAAPRSGVLRRFGVAAPNACLVGKVDIAVPAAFVVIGGAYQPAASRFRQKSWACTPSGNYGTARIPPVPQLLFAALAVLATGLSGIGISGSGRGARLTRAELAFADHPLVPVHLMLDPVAGRVAFAEEQANDFEAAFGGVFDAPLREKFHCLADAVFVL